jgi:hypothetical protein
MSEALELKRLLGIGGIGCIQPADSIHGALLSRSHSTSPIHHADMNEKKDDSENHPEVATEMPMKDSLGWKMLTKMGWKSGQGIGIRGEGRIEPVLPKNDDALHGGKCAGLHHASEVLSLENNRKPLHELESWEAGTFFKPRNNIQACLEPISKTVRPSLTVYSCMEWLFQSSISAILCRFNQCTPRFVYIEHSSVQRTPFTHISKRLQVMRSFRE